MNFKEKYGRTSIELVSNTNDFRGVFGEVLDTVKDTFGNLTINNLNFQDLLGQLKTQAFPLSDIITNAINQKEGVALDYALINDIKYNLLDNTFHFIFDIDLHLIDD
ncbi:hypothetical protein VN0453_05770 [Helicobacter pylori]|nr:hypothetical protein VN0453_05770 [Helicobacter pylori]